MIVLRITFLCSETDRSWVQDLIFEFSDFFEMSVILTETSYKGNYIAVITKEALGDDRFMRRLHAYCNAMKDGNKVNLLLCAVGDVRIPESLMTRRSRIFRIPIIDNDDQRERARKILMIAVYKHFLNDIIGGVSYASPTISKQHGSILIVLGILGVIALFVANSILEEKETFLIPAFIVLLAIIVSGCLLILFSAFKFKDSQTINNYYSWLKNIGKANRNGDNKNETFEEPVVDALEWMQINLTNIKEYYIWSQKQARHSFVLAVLMCIIGLVLLAASIFIPVLTKTDIEVSFISAIGGIVVEFIAATSLFVYKSSVQQLNYYHSSLHEDERFLSCVNLIDKFSSAEKSDKMLEEIIQSEIKMNLLSVEKSINNSKK